MACVKEWHSLRCEAHGQCTDVFEPNERLRATPATYADARNLRLKRRNY